MDSFGIPVLHVNEIERSLLYSISIKYKGIGLYLGMLGVQGFDRSGSYCNKNGSKQTIDRNGVQTVENRIEDTFVDLNEDTHCDDK